MMGPPRSLLWRQSPKFAHTPLDQSHRQDLRAAAQDISDRRSEALALVASDHAAKVAAARRLGGPGLAALLEALQAERRAKETAIRLQAHAEQLAGNSAPAPKRPKRPRRQKAANRAPQP